MRLSVQPDAGTAPVLEAIGGAKNSVDIAIFRFDCREIEDALVKAARRGVNVCALIAFTNKGDGEKGLEGLERRLQDGEVTTVRTADDLVRYHDKLLIVDGRELHLLAFNCTHLDLRSRSFGISLTDGPIVAEAVKLFRADVHRKRYAAGHPDFVVSPVNARDVLGGFIQSAKNTIELYDPKVADPAMIHLLEERANAGVQVRVIGQVTRKHSGFEVRKLAGMRLHARTMIVDGKAVFIGSQSLRALELDSRREAGVIVHDREIAGQVVEVFNGDWERSGAQGSAATEPFPASKVAKKTAKAISRKLPSVVPVVEEVVKKVAGEEAVIPLDPELLEDAVKQAVRHAVREAVEQVVEGEVK